MCRFSARATAVAVSQNSGGNSSQSTSLSSTSSIAQHSSVDSYLYAGATAVAVYQSRGGNSSQSTILSSTSSIASANDDYYAASNAISQGLTQLQLSMGSAAPSSLSLYLEPAFFPRAGTTCTFRATLSCSAPLPRLTDTVDYVLAHAA